MPFAPDRRHTWAAVAAVVAGIALVVWGLTSRSAPSGRTEGRAPAATTAAATPTSSATPTPTPTPTASTAQPAATPRAKLTPAPTFGPSTVKPEGKPARVVVVAASGRVLVDAALTPDRLDEDGVLAPPFGLVGWYAEPGWAKPGWPGAAILAGHINRRSPSLKLDTFGHLTKVRPGDRVTVVYSSGQSTTFTATQSRAMSKKAVPRDDSIWDADNPRPVLRLITCDPTTPVNGGHYTGNWVVWASMT